MIPGQWMLEGLCAQTDPELFFQDGGNPRKAKMICKGCSVIRECGEYALRNPEPLDGIWGGLSERERRDLRAQRRRAA